MPRKAKGTLEWRADHWRVRLTLEDGTRPWIHLEPGLTEAEARARAEALSSRARELGAVRLGSPTAAAQALTAETVKEWGARWADAREAKGQTSVDDDRGRLKNHIYPVIGDVPMRLLTAAQLEQLVDKLDRKVQRGEISWKTATHVWGLATKMCDDAHHSKDLTLRCRDDNPALGVRGPDKGEPKSKVFIYPSEFLRLVSCDAVSLRWRRIYAVATYLYLRAGELEVLECEDLDLAHGTVHVHQAVNRMRGGVKGVKTGLTRRFRLEPEVVPLLEALVKEAGGHGRLVRLPPVEDLAAELRKHLARAGVTRADLFANDATRKWMTFHDLRATGITWMAVRGDEPLKIKQRAGHKVFSTTEGYIREAESVRDGFGEVFPALPAALVESSLNRPRDSGAVTKPLENKRRELATPTGFEPVLPT